MCTQERNLTNLHGGNILSLNMFFLTERELTNPGPGEDDESNDEEVDNVIQHFREKGKRKTNKKPGRKPRWCPKSLDDLIDIIVNSTNYKTKLIFTNTKNQKNGPI